MTCDGGEGNVLKNVCIKETVTSSLLEALVKLNLKSPVVLVVNVYMYTCVCEIKLLNCHYSDNYVTSLALCWQIPWVCPFSLTSACVSVAG